MRVLVVDDEKEMRDSLKIALESESFNVDTAADGRAGSYSARTNDYDVIILDNVMPEKSGLEVCKEIRESGKETPILMLSVKAEISDKTSLIDSGADDYLTKPYSHTELVSRMRALMRRSNKIEPIIYYAGGLILNGSTQQVSLNGAPIYLTRKEFALLELLLKERGTVVSRGMIMEHVWDMEGNPLSKSIETHILNLRRKIEDSSLKIILNIPGRGYKIN